MRAFLLLACCAVLAAESLWRAETLADGNLYADATARRRGDLLTVVISETTSVSENQKTGAERSSTMRAGVDYLTGTNAPPAASGAGIGALPGLSANSRNSFEGEGKYDLSHRVRTTIAVQVVDVLDNGSLVVRGAREVVVNDDRKTIQIAGIVRPSDIRSDNTVLSEKLFDLQVSIVGEGPLTRSQERGWLGRVLDWLWPF
ncbi:MAG: flagellar basal body L-ring protein FlgH [Planctomycetota bacterium]|nr:flagellar basal body L-ring protein FlgH [Planctomycetota bacterium]